MPELVRPRDLTFGDERKNRKEDTGAGVTGEQKERERQGANKAEGGGRRRRGAPQGGRTPAIYWILEINDHLYTRRKVRSVEFETRYFGRFPSWWKKRNVGRRKRDSEKGEKHNEKSTVSVCPD